MGEAAYNQNLELNSGRLIGWLVSFDDGEQVFELRSGTIFIGSDKRSQLNHRTVKGEGIEPLHIVLKAQTNHVLLIQDLFTQAGSFVKRPVLEDEVRINKTTELHHGDWLRLGNSKKFQVCLIDGPSK